MRRAYVYIVTNKSRGIPYIGVTTDIRRRMSEHKAGDVEGFTKKYRLVHLVYIEVFERIDEAIAREKQLKNWHRQWKINLIEASNPEWRDLTRDVLLDPETSSG